MDQASDSPAEQAQDFADPEVPRQPITRFSVWPLAIASVLFTIIAYRAFVQYAFVHWKVLASHGIQLGLQMPEEARSRFFSLLGDLEIIRKVAGVSAVVFALLALKGRPRWPAICAVVISIIGLIASAGVM